MLFAYTVFEKQDDLNIRRRCLQMTVKMVRWIGVLSNNLVELINCLHLAI